MAYTEEKKQEILRLLATEAGNNIARCTQLTGISKTTLLKWKKAQDKNPEITQITSQPAIPTSELPKPKPEPEPKTPQEAPLPTPAELKRRIIRRVSQLIDTCTDLKKLMDTHEALSKTERDSTPPTQESLFDLLSRQLSAK